MVKTLEKRLRDALSGMPSDDVHAVVAFAEFLTQRRRIAGSEVEPLSDEEHARILSAMDGVAALSMVDGPPVSNREHDQYLYGSK